MIYLLMFNSLFSSAFVYYHLTPCKSLYRCLWVVFSLETEGQQDFSGLLDSFEYTCQSKECCGLDGLNSSSDFQSLQSFFKPLGTIPSAPTTNGYYESQFFSVLRQGSSICLSFHFLSFSFCGQLEWQNLPDDKFFFTC